MAESKEWEHVSRELERRPVEGGYLYRTWMPGISDQERAVMAAAFVPTPRLVSCCDCAFAVQTDRSGKDYSECRLRAGLPGPSGDAFDISWPVVPRFTGACSEGSPRR